jgi:hypothetical protein
MVVAGLPLYFASKRRAEPVFSRTETAGAAE